MSLQERFLSPGLFSAYKVHRKPCYGAFALPIVAPLVFRFVLMLFLCSHMHELFPLKDLKD